jgi:Flp pilus assembly protein TadD
MSLFRILAADPARRDEAGAALDTALAAVPDNPELLWAKAGFLEQAGDLDGAIGIYEALYARDSTNTIIANNLASLLSTHRTDEQSLARAEVIARRLRDSDIAAFQDTYGWIAFRRGNVGEALPVLEKAAEVLTDDPQVQYHLARAYLASGRDADALAQFQRVIDLAGDGDTRPFVTESRTEAARLAGTAGSAGN